MAITVDENLNRKVLQHIRTTKDANQIGPHGSVSMLSGTTAIGEIAVQLGDADSGNTGTSLWTLASDGKTAVRFVNQAYVDARVGGSASALEAELNNVEASVGLNNDGTMPANVFDNTNYLSALTADTVVNALKELDGELKRVDDAVLDSLEVNSMNADNDKIIVDFEQHEGLVGSADTKNVGQFTITGYSEGSDAKLAETDTLNAALGKLQGQINAMDLSVVSGDGQVIIAVSEDDGKVSASKANLTDVKLVGYNGDHGTVSSADTLGEAIDKIEDEIAAAVSAVTVASADNSIAVTTASTGTDVAVNIKSGEHVLAKDGGNGLYTNIELSGITPSSTNVKEEYILKATDGTQLGESIKIYKDSAYKEIYLGTSADTINTSSGEITKESGDKQSLNYAYMKADGTYDLVKVDVSAFLSESEFASGVTATDHIVHGVVASTSEKDSQATPQPFLTVDGDGFKVSGIKDEIDRKINALDVTGDTAVAGQYVAAIEEADGIVAVKTRANVSEAVLNNYAKGSDATAVAATDTVNQAISKLENQIDAAKASATTKVEKDANAVNLTIVSATSQDGSVTYTIGQTDIASASALTAEIDRAQAAEGEIAGLVGITGNETARAYGHSGTNYLDGNTTVKADAEELDDLLGNYTGITGGEYAVDFSTKSAAERIGELMKEIDDAKEALTITAVDDDKYIATEVISADTGTTIGVSAITTDLTATTSSNSALIDAWDGKSYFVHELVDSTSTQGVNDFNVVAVAANGTDGLKYDFKNLVVDCGTF